MLSNVVWLSYQLSDKTNTAGPAFACTFLCDHPWLVQRSKLACITWQQGGKSCCSVCNHFRLFCIKQDNSSIIIIIIQKPDSSSNIFQVILPRYFMLFCTSDSRLQVLPSGFSAHLPLENKEGKIIKAIFSLWDIVNIISINIQYETRCHMENLVSNILMLPFTGCKVDYSWTKLFFNIRLL